MRRIAIGVALLFGAITMLPTSTLEAQSQEVCLALDSGKIDTAGDPLTVTMTAPPGNLITQYCVKAGSDTSIPDGAVVYVTVDPPQAEITVAHPSGKSVSHYSFAWEPIPVETTTTTVPDSTTTVPESTTTVPGSTTTVPESTTTVPDSTTTTAAAVIPPTTTGNTAVLVPVNPPADSDLPETGSSSWTTVWVALVALAAGLGLMRLARRDEDSEVPA